MNAISQLQKRHRSIRRYKPDPIDPGIVDQVLGDAIEGSASSGNLNSVSIVLTRDSERKRRLYELHFEQPMVLQAPLVITFCADWFRTREWLRLRGARDNFNNLIGYHVAAYDTMIVAQNAFLGFQAHGLGSCYMGTTLHSMTEIAAFLELPDTCVPVTTIVVGWPAEDPDKRDRLPLSAMVHEERYQRPTIEQLEAMYEEREVRGWQRYLSSVPDFKARVEALGITTLAQYYTSKAKYDPDLFRADSAKIAALLAAKHFLP